MNVSMKLAAGAAAVVVGMSAFGTTASAGDVEAGVDVASSYIFRGATLNDSFVAQPFLEAGGLGGLTLGVWGNFDLDDNAGGSPEGGHFSEIDIYGSYDLPIESDVVGLSIGYTEYAYPRAGGTVGADGETVEPVDADREVSLVASFDTVASPSIGVYYGVDGGIDSDVYVELGVSHEQALDEASGLTGDIGATLGYLSPDVGDDGFSHLTLNAGLSYEMFSLGVMYVIETDKDVLTVDEDVAGVLGFSHAW